MAIEIKLQVNSKAIQDRLENLFDEKTMLELHNLLAKMCDPYVPFLEGPLSQSGLAHVTSEGVTYGGDSVPYARYQYYGTEFNHTKDYHPKATAMWDKAMLQEKEDEFKQQVTDILKRRTKELYG